MIYDFLTAKDLSSKKTNTFNALLMAAVRIGSSEDLLKLQKAFPEIVSEAIARGNTKDGQLPTD